MPTAKHFPIHQFHRLFQLGLHTNFAADLSLSRPRLCTDRLQENIDPKLEASRTEAIPGSLSTLLCFCTQCCVLWATHGLPTVWASVYRGRDPPVCPLMPRQDGIGGKAPTRACELCVGRGRVPVRVACHMHSFD